jgi:hypothetical protein
VVTSPGNGSGFAEAAGSMVAITFGAVFVLVNSAGLPGPWRLAIRLAGVLVAAVLVAGLLLALRRAPATRQAPVSGFADRRYWIVVALEAVALFAGLFVLNGVLHRPAVSVAWVATVVGVHFFPLARNWQIPLFHWLGAVMTLLGLAGFVIYAVGGTATAVALVAGVGSGAALYSAVGLALGRTLHRRSSPAGSPSPPVPTTCTR